MIQRDGGRYNMNQVPTLSKRGKRRFKINIKRLKAPSYCLNKFEKIYEESFNSVDIMVTSVIF